MALENVGKIVHTADRMKEGGEGWGKPDTDFGTFLAESRGGIFADLVQTGFHLKNICRESIDFRVLILPCIGRKTGFLTGMLQKGLSIPPIFGCNLW